MKGKLKKKMEKAGEFQGYGEFLDSLKKRIRQAQVKAALSVNREMILLYWEIGCRIHAEQDRRGWGAAVIPRLAKDLKNELPEVKGFSERNLKRMLRFFREYPFLPQFVPQLAAQMPAEAELPKVPQAVAQTGGHDQVILSSLAEALLNLPWGHNVILFEKVKDLKVRLWYMQQAIENGWSRNVLEMMIDSHLDERAGKAITNFQRVLPPPQSDLADQALKDPYIFDFLTLEKPFRERELENNLLVHLEKFLLELGAGFAFVGRQVRMEVGDQDFYIDLLFYHLKLRCFVVIELKTGPFKADYAGKMNFYLNLVDDRLRHPTDNPSIGLILCQDKNRVVAEYALRGLTKAIGVSEYQLTRALPREFQSSLPSIEEIEAELGGVEKGKSERPKKARKEDE